MTIDEGDVPDVVKQILRGLQSGDTDTYGFLLKLLIIGAGGYITVPLKSVEKAAAFPGMMTAMVNEEEMILAFVPTELIPSVMEKVKDRLKDETKFTDIVDNRIPKQ